MKRAAAAVMRRNCDGRGASSLEGRLVHLADDPIVARGQDELRLPLVLVHHLMQQQLEFQNLFLAA